MDSVGLSWRSTEVFVIQGGAAHSILMAVHANRTQVTFSSTAYWITKLSLGVVSCGSSAQTLTLIHPLLGRPCIPTVQTGDISIFSQSFYVYRHTISQAFVLFGTFIYVVCSYFCCHRPDRDSMFHLI